MVNMVIIVVVVMVVKVIRTDRTTRTRDKQQQVLDHRRAYVDWRMLVNFHNWHRSNIQIQD